MKLFFYFFAVILKTVLHSKVSDLNYLYAELSMQTH